ncbi:hemolysin XhlA family protein [Clostridium sp. 19966]|uniref:hemolysin XhlA family protein n=1 Tax=Clostridium sp. 19966 TaxID=2768166 RepID=UPI0028DD7E43|nr:hemolysin XhlA family protein [Clostridium sp. 19966]MDT8719701.1 hemolysin XhlA family protein [Clostridium sp. 19966]
MEKDDKIQEILERLVRMETKLDDFNSIRDKAEQAYTNSLQALKEIQEIKDNNKWLWRTSVGGIIVIILNLIVQLKIH